MAGFSLCECGVGTFILHESSHRPFLFISSRCRTSYYNPSTQKKI